MSKFFFGAALSAHQCEGNNIHSDWWQFEQLHLNKLGIRSGNGTKHWENFEEDFKLASELGHNSHRFSIEWAKIEPQEGQIDQNALNHYHEVFKTLRKYQLTPFVTLFHFSQPQWFAAKGGFEKMENIQYFVNFCKLIATTFQDELIYIITINEPNVYAYNSYLTAKWPPLKKSWWKYSRILLNLSIAHKKVYKALKQIKPEFRIGISSNHQIFHPNLTYNPLDSFTAKILNYECNYLFLDRIRNKMDFIGVNYYFYHFVKTEINLVDRLFHVPYPSPRKTDMNWPIYPQGIYIALKDLHQRYKQPIIVTENGVADGKDHLRDDILNESLEWLFKAREEGVNVVGYLHWALTDNFEWDSGFEPKFGLIQIDYQNNFLRTIRPSALTYQSLIKKYSEQYNLQ